MATDTASRASMDHQAMRSVSTGADRGRVKNALDEALRKTAGSSAIAFYARKNPAINPEVSHLNIDMVNDGAGSFKPAASIAEVQAHIDGRRGRLTRELKAEQRHVLTTVVHLPSAYIEPDGTEYHATDERTGKKKHHRDGSPVMLSRYRIRPDKHPEAMRFFDSYLDFHAKLLPGGHEAVAGYSINLDESRPHAQIFSDVYGSDISKKHPRGLKNGYQQAFGTHRKDRKVVQLDKKTGNPVLDSKTGKPRMVLEGGSRKMERYHAELKEFLLAKGFEIEAERDAVRHARRVDLDDYKDLADDRQVVAAELGAAVEYAADAAGMHEDALADAAGEAAVLHQAAAERLAEAAVARETAEAAGYEAGVGAGAAQAQNELVAATAARAAAEQSQAGAAQAQGAAQAHEAALTLAREDAEAQLAEARDRVAAAVAHEAQAAMDRQGTERALAEAEARLAEIPEYDAAADVDGQSRFLVQALRQDKQPDGTSALDSYLASAQALYNREKGLGRNPVARQTEGERRAEAQARVGRSQNKIAEAGKTQQRGDNQTHYQ